MERSSEDFKEEQAGIYTQSAHQRNDGAFENRDGSGINPTEAHETLSTIVEIGCDPEHLRKATCFELNNDPNTAMFQKLFNETLVDRSEKKLAPLTGHEKFLTVACSHFTASLRAAAHGCPTPCKNLQGTDGTINKLALCKADPEFEALFEEGWEWTVLSSSVEVQWPELPDLAQKALNAEHSTYNKCSELQVMCAIAHKLGTNDLPKEGIIKMIMASKPACHEYLGDLYEYVVQFGGGEGGPIIRFVESFAKEYGKNKVLGPTFWQTIVGAKMQTVSATNTLVFVRAACIAANLICPANKVKDGFAKLLVPSDINTMMKSANALQVTSADASLCDAWRELSEAVDEGVLTIPLKNQVFGAMASRVALFLTGKGKEGLEKTSYANLAAIREKFHEDKEKALGGQDAKFAAATSSSAKKPKEQTPDATVSLEDAADPCFIARKGGFIEASCSRRSLLHPSQQFGDSLN